MRGTHSVSAPNLRHPVASTARRAPLLSECSDGCRRLLRVSESKYVFEIARVTKQFFKILPSCLQFYELCTNLQRRWISVCLQFPWGHRNHCRVHLYGRGGEYSLEIEEDVTNDATQGQQAFSFQGELSKGRNTHRLLAWQYV